jgi:uncharacterized RDD family membrane protein YckC
VDADEDGVVVRCCGAEVAEDQGNVRLASRRGVLPGGIDVALIRNHAELTVFGWQDAFGDAVNIALVGHAVADEVGYGDHLESVRFAKFDEVGNAGHGSVFVHDLADDAGGDQASHAGEIDRGLGLAGADEDAAFAGAEGEDVAGTGEVIGRGVGANGDLDGVGAVGGRDAGGDAFAGFDGFGECGAEAGGVVLGHGAEAHVVGTLFGEGEADEAAAEAGHEVNGLGGTELGGEGEVAFVLAVLIVDDDDHAASLELGYRFEYVDESSADVGHWPMNESDSWNAASLEGRLDLKAPGLEESFRNVLRVLVTTRPLAETGGADVLVGGELVFLYDHLEGSDGGDDRADGFGLAPVGISAAFCHVGGSSLFRRLLYRNTSFYHFLARAIVSPQVHFAMRNFSARETEWLLELDGIELASFQQRALALAIDSCILTGVFILVFAAFMLIFLGARLVADKVHGYPMPSVQQIVTSFPFNLEAKDSATARFFDSEYVQVFSDVALPVLYFGVLLWKGKGQTPGKRIMRIRVMSIVHRHLSFWHSVERALGYGAAGLEGGFGFVQFFIHPYRRCAQDRLAETIVVTERGYQAMQHKWDHPLLPDTNTNRDALE